MEERSAAAFGNDGSEEEEELFEEGYEGDLVLTVRHGDLIPPQPHLHAVGTRRQKTLAGERLLLPARCKDKNCWKSSNSLKNNKIRHTNVCRTDQNVETK